MNLTTTPDRSPPAWVSVMFLVSGIGAGVGFVIYNLLLLVGILTGRFRKP
jgi:hypothetical protein